MEAIELYNKINDPITAIEQVGEFFSKSGMFGVTRKEQGMVLAMACMVERKSPLEIISANHIIDGKLAMKSERMLANFRKLGGKVKWEQFDEKAAVGTWSLDGNDTKIGYSMEDAKRAGVIRPNSAWTKNPDAMLRARCISKAVRMLAPEAANGCYAPEEIQDFETTITASSPLLRTEAPQKKEVILENTDSDKIGSGTIIEVKAEPVTAPEPVEIKQVPSERQLLIAQVEEKIRSFAETPEKQAAVEQGAIEFFKKIGYVKTSLMDLPDHAAKKIISNPPPSFVQEMKRLNQ